MRRERPARAKPDLSQNAEWRHPEPGFSRVKDLARIIPTPGDVEKPIPAAESLTSMCTPLRDAASCIMPTGVHKKLQS